MRLVGEVAVISGGSGSIGLATAKRLKQEGAAVAILDVREPVGLQEFSFFPCDVSDEREVKAAIDRVADSLGPPGIFVHCAAITAFKEVVRTSRQEFERIMAVNVWGGIAASQACLPYMEQNLGGCIVLVSSITGIIGASGMAAYAASKGALITLTRTMAVELAPRNVRVNCVCPGSVDTPMLRASFEIQPDPARARLENIKRHPLGRLGSPEDVANLIAFLCSREADWITGATYVIDGGASIYRR